MNVVSGSSGFIGSALKEMLPDAVGFDKRESEWTDIVADLSDPYFTWAGGEVDTLYHLAAEPLTMYSGDWLAASVKAFRNNAVGTYNAIREMHPKRIVFTSTANIYGEGLNLSECSPVRIGSPYGYSKIVAESIVKHSGIPCLIVRLGTVVGPRGRTFPNRLVWSAVHGESVELYCGGEAHRSLVDVSDVVDALQMLPDGVFNVAWDGAVSGGGLAEYVNRIAEYRGYTLKYTVGCGHPQGYVKDSTLDVERAIGVGWVPQVDPYWMIEGLFDYYEAGGVEPPRCSE
jgi:nucleoside-diphosphate-sugar epimerase